MKHLFHGKFEIKLEKNEDDVDSIDSHFNKLKLFNFTIEQDSKREIDENNVQVKQNEDYSFDLFYLFII